LPDRDVASVLDGILKALHQVTIHRLSHRRDANPMQGLRNFFLVHVCKVTQFHPKKQIKPNRLDGVSQL